MMDSAVVEVMGITGSPTVTQSISLPHEEMHFFRNLANAKRFAIDIGGSLTKIAYFSTVSHRRVRVPEGSDSDSNEQNTEKVNFTYEVCQAPRLHFIKFETKYIQECLDFIQKHLLGQGLIGQKFVKATGGGSYKYSKLIEDKLGITPEKEDEMDCLIKGANFLLKNVSQEAFTYDRRRSPEYHFLPPGPVLFPYLLVNVGSGVSILKVESEEKYERIGGTATGGGTFWGLGTLLTGAKGFDELLRLAEEGDHRKVDMLVRDIYSGDYVTLGLPGDLIASSFGKAAHLNSGDFSAPDVARSLLFTIANDIGQIACLYALQHNLKRIYFGGYFLRNHPLTMYAVSYAIRYWSKETVEPLFLRHEGYLGAIGAFLKGTEELHTEKYSWQENYAGSSGFMNGELDTSYEFPSRISVGFLEMDRAQRPVGYFPLLSPDVEYSPDTVNLAEDVEARTYWISCFEGSLDRITERAIESQASVAGSIDRALRCKRKLLDRFRTLSIEPCAYGNLTVRSLLNTIEQCLREFDFPDPYFSQKQGENSFALREFDNQLRLLDSLTSESRNVELIWGVLAGNVFDWGANAVAALLEGPATFGFEEAKAELQRRPWLVDSLDRWLERLKKKAHRCITFFVDNSGIDFVLGVLPLVREFLRNGSRVILCANSEPALNDMTYDEMVPLLRLVGGKCNVIQDAMDQGRLMPHETGQDSPCLDLSRISQDLIQLIEREGSDLVIIEGMGRAIHTNLSAKFKTEVLKLAVIKNAWLAKTLGGEVFSVVCSYEEPDSFQQC